MFSLLRGHVCLLLARTALGVVLAKRPHPKLPFEQ